MAVPAVVGLPVRLKCLAGKAGVIGRPRALGTEISAAGTAADAVAAAVLGGLGRQGLPGGVGLGLGGLEVGGTGRCVDELHHDPAGGVGTGEEVPPLGGEVEG